MVAGMRVWFWTYDVIKIDCYNSLFTMSYNNQFKV